MYSNEKDLRMVNRGQAGRLLGLTIREMNDLKEEGKGPEVIGDGDYVAYAIHAVRAWAMLNVIAPIAWFDRFSCANVNDVTRTEIRSDANNEKYYLNEHEEAWLIFKMVYDGGYEEKEGVYRLYFQDYPKQSRDLFHLSIRGSHKTPRNPNISLVK
jgi:hypothetical protein